MKNTITKIKKIISYIPVLWNDRDWDYTCLDNLMLHKMKRMKVLFEKDKDKPDWCFGKEHIVKKQNSYKALCICINILERQTQDFYFNTYSYLIDNEPIWEDLDDKFMQLSKNWTISSNMEMYNKKEHEAELIKIRDEKLFSYLFSKYKTYWWV